jgi:hypothetical protein
MELPTEQATRPLSPEIVNDKEGSDEPTQPAAPTSLPASLERQDAMYSTLIKGLNLVDSKSSQPLATLERKADGTGEPRSEQKEGDNVSQGDNKANSTKIGENTIISQADGPVNQESDVESHQSSTKPSDPQDQDTAIKNQAPSLQTPRKANDSIPFKDCKISFAIDTSGSTLGRILASEKRSIYDICSLLSGPAKEAVRILPWSSHAEDPSDISGLELTSSYGGTDPQVLLQSRNSLITLQNSSLWFLLTDGEIPEYSLNSFALEIPERQLHGTACVVVVFGSKASHPANANTSVGVSIFAIVPDCLFLFQDIDDQETYLMSCKGRFTEILERSKQQHPVLSDRIKWEDLPRVIWNDLAVVSIKPPKKLRENEVALENNLVINLDDLLSGKLKDKRIIDAILDSQENIRTVSLTAQTRGQAELLRNWAIKQELSSSNFSQIKPGDIRGQAKESMTVLMERFHTMSTSTGALHDAQSKLRAAHAQNSKAFIRVDSSAVHKRHESITSVVARSSSAITSSRSLSLTYFPDVSSSEDENGDGQLTPTEGENLARRLLFNPGFLKSYSETDEFQRTCPLCATENSTLAFLLRRPPSARVTPGFPGSGSNSKVAYPLAVGNFPETDIIASLICCEACSVVAVEKGSLPSGDQIICALPLVSYSLNKDPYDSRLQEAYQNRFNSEDVPLVFIASLYMRAHRIRAIGSSRDQQLLHAIEWVCLDLARSVQCVESLSISDGGQGLGSGLSPLDEVLVHSAEETLASVSNAYFQYPMEGFVVMTMILDTLQKSKQKPKQNLGQVLQNTVFLRLLFHIVDRFHGQLKEQGPIVTHIFMSEMLIQDKAKGKEKKLASFRGLAGLTRNIFGDRKALTPKLSIGLDLLARTPLVTSETIGLFKKLGSLFDWVEVKSGHALAVFIHYMYRYKVEGKTPEDHFAELLTHIKLARIFFDPSDISARTAEKLIELLPPLGEPIDEKTRMGQSPSPVGTPI